VRILHVITTLDLGGAENQLFILSRKQVMAGNQVSVAFLKGTGKLAKKFKKSGIEVDFRLANKNFLFQIVLKNLYYRDFELLHLHLPRSELIFSIFPLNLPIINTRHNAELFLPKAQKVKWLSMILAKISTRKTYSVVAISHSVKNYIKARKEISSNSKITLIYYGIGNNKNQIINTRNSVIKSHNSLYFRIGTIARLVDQKRIDILIKGYAQFVQFCPNSKLEIIGEGKRKNDLIRLSSTLKCEDKVHFLGESLDPWRKAKKWQCFILTSAYEGFGLVLLEAMANGIPIIASRIPSTEEVLGIEFPFLFDPENDQQLFHLIKKVIESNFDFNKYYSARLKVFSVEQLYQSHQDLYLSALDADSL
jgi:glycosyltransferase involved in cell wall biosynthesis